MIKENYEYIVEFRVTVVDPIYSKLFSDPGDPQYNDIKLELKEKVRVMSVFTGTDIHLSTNTEIRGMTNPQISLKE